MKRALLTIGLVLALTHFLRADDNLTISDVGLHGYMGSVTAVRMQVRNPSSQMQSIHLKVMVKDDWSQAKTVSGEVSLGGGEQRYVEFPMLFAGGQPKITAEARVGNTLIGRDKNTRTVRRNNLVVLMCGNAENCKTVQSQIQFSGTVEDRADKNRGLTFDVMDDPRDNWWSYSGANCIVLATPLTNFQPAQLEALEGYLRQGGRLVLMEQAIATPGFLASYRQGPLKPRGERVGRGMLFRVSSGDSLGDVFTGKNLPGVLNPTDSMPWLAPSQTNLLRNRFATAFAFPQLRWLLVWLAAYILIIGLVNFFVLRRLRRLEFGWISTCILALVFAAAMYSSSASRRPKEFHLDNLATYFLDANSGTAAVDYVLRFSTPERQNIAVAVNDPAVFISSNLWDGETNNSQIWSEMNRERTYDTERSMDVNLGPPGEVEFPMLKWSFRDLELRGLRAFPGTVHFVAPNRLRNDTGRRLSEPVYVDYEANALYVLPELAPSQEIDLSGITPKLIRVAGQAPVFVFPDDKNVTLRDLATASSAPFGATGRYFAALSDGPALPVDISVRHQLNVHSLIFVSMGQP